MQTSLIRFATTVVAAFTLGGCSIFPPILPETCGTRYADANLDLPDNGVAYEMITQIAHLLKSDEPHNPIPSAYPVKRIFHTGIFRGKLVTGIFVIVHWADIGGRNGFR